MQIAREETIESLLILNDDLENYFANTIIPQLFVDANLILRKYTPAAMKQFSFTPEDIGKNIKDVEQNIQYSTLVENITEVIGTGNILEKEIQTSNKKWYQMNILPYFIRKENKTNGVIITFVDITNRIIALKEMTKLNKGYETFIYGVVHDIKQPLTKLLVLPELLEHAYTSNNNENFLKSVDLLNKSAKNINALLTEFTHYINEQTETLTTQERVNIEDIFIDVQLALKDLTANEDAVIATKFETSEITFSRTGLRSILYNLISNAIKYKKPDENSKILISTIKTDGYVLLSVKDNGIGIDEQYHETIFKKCTRVSTNVEGTGMGLFIIKNMVENNGGRVEVKSTLGEGAIFNVYFKSDAN